MFPTTRNLTRRYVSTRIAFIVAIATVLVGPTAWAGDAGALADKMLERLGGRAAWAGLKNTINGSQQNRAGEPTVVYAVITMDFERPRFRIETTAQDLHLIGARDLALSFASEDDGRLEVLAGDQRILWFKLDAKGEPYAFGAWDDDTGSLSGPWDFVKDGIHHPRWVSSADGTWRAAVRALDVNVPRHDSAFARPDE